MNENKFEIEPYVITNPENKISNPFSLTYTNQDYWGFKNKILEYIKNNHGDDFNDFTESSIVIMLAEMFAFLGDTLSFKIDQLANELFIDTVSEKANAFRLAKLVGFKPSPPTPARAMFYISINNPLQYDLRIQTPVKISYDIPGQGSKGIELFSADANNNPILGHDIIIPAGEINTNAVIGIEGMSRSVSIEGRGIANQVIKLEQGKILLGSISLAIDGVMWKPVDHFSSTEAQNEYLIEYNENYNVVIIFGDNKAGKIPPKGSKIGVSYRQGGGTVGNIVTGAIETDIRVAVEGVGYIVVAKAKNYTKGQFGYDGDTIDDIRRKLPLFLKTQNRAVTDRDYEGLAELFSSPYNGSIAKANAVLRNHGCAGNIIDLYVLAHDGNNVLSKPNDNLKTELAQEINSKKMLTDYVCIKNGEMLLVDIDLDVTVSSIYKRSENAIRDKINRRMESFFSINNWHFGKPLKENDIIRTLTDIKEIEHIDLTFTTLKGLESGQGEGNIITCKYYEIIRPDNLILYLNFR